MRPLKSYLKTYPLSCLCIVVVWVLSLMPMPETPLDNVSFIDKWTHLVMYGGTSAVIWVEYLWRHKKISRKKLLLLGWLAPVLMGGLLEILQATCTGGRRNGDWMDFVANGAGATLTLCVGTLWVWFRARR